LASRSLTELKIDGWRSEYSSVNNVLRHLQRKSSGYGFGSYSSVTGYAEILSWLVRFSRGKNPDELVGSHLSFLQPRLPIIVGRSGRRNVPSRDKSDSDYGRPYD
jgi:hypothetical protein